MRANFKNRFQHPLWASLGLHGFVILIFCLFFALKKPIPSPTEVSVGDVSDPHSGPNAKMVQAVPELKTKVDPLDEPLSEAHTTDKIIDPPGGNSNSVQTQKTGNLQANAYFLELSRRIQAEQRYPMEAKKRGITSTIEIYFQLNEAGQITEIHSVSEGKPQILVEAAIDAVKAASPFSAPPAGSLRVFQIPIEFKIK